MKAPSKNSHIPAAVRSSALELVSPVIRLLPPWWKARLYGRLAGGGFGERAERGEEKRIRVSPHQYEMTLQLDDPMERFAYFVGCYWGLDVTAAVLRLLDKGDYFIDVGANLGFLTLLRARLVVLARCLRLSQWLLWQIACAKHCATTKSTMSLFARTPWGTWRLKATMAGFLANPPFAKQAHGLGDGWHAAIEQVIGPFEEKRVLVRRIRG